MADVRAEVVAVGHLSHRLQQPGEAHVQIIAAQLDEAAGAFLAGPGQPGIVQHAARGRSVMPSR